MHILMKYQLSSISQKLINPTDPSQITLTYTVLYFLDKILKKQISWSSQSIHHDRSKPTQTTEH